MKKILMVLLALSASGSVMAGDSYRCGRGVINQGMSFQEVTHACGNEKPVEVRRGSVDKGLSGYAYSDGTMPIVTEQLEDWYYAPYGKFVTIVRFTNGRVSGITRTSDRAGK